MPACLHAPGMPPRLSPDKLAWLCMTYSPAWTLRWAKALLTQALQAPQGPAKLASALLGRLSKLH